MDHRPEGQGHTIHSINDDWQDVPDQRKQHRSQTPWHSGGQGMPEKKSIAGCSPFFVEKKSSGRIPFGLCNAGPAQRQNAVRKVRQ